MEIGQGGQFYTQAGSIRDGYRNGRADGEGSGYGLIFERLAVDTHRSAKP
jgi:hypothetical protein